MDRRDKGTSRRGVLLAAGASIALTAMAEPPQAITITRKVSAGPETPGKRADLAEQAIVQRHVRTLWGRPQMRLGTSTVSTSAADE
ncbi:hypothetical protein ACQPW1_09685 [Nocardia sp. CA-128927]|uniref:hypothetical protein n=1 Tax=Nocardia sp. CA-128927 TaxID=3239975 RepID=UPI003D97AEB9